MSETCALYVISNVKINVKITFCIIFNLQSNVCFVSNLLYYSLYYNSPNNTRCGY